LAESLYIEPEETFEPYDAVLNYPLYEGRWHEVWPQYCKVYNLSRVYDPNSYLAPCDTILLHCKTPPDSCISAKYHVRRVATNILVAKEPASIQLRLFSAAGNYSTIVLTWITATEIDNAGFNIHRGLGKEGPNIQLNEVLIPAQGDELQGATYSFTDYDVTNGVIYYYWLEDVDLRGNSTIHGPVSAIPTSVEDREEAPIPTDFSLAQNYPNPFNATTAISYQLSGVSPQRTTLKVYNIAGQEVRTLVDEEQAPGYYSVSWDGRDNLDKDVSSGIYFYRLQAGSYTEMKKMVLLK